MVLYIFVSEAGPIICKYGGQINVPDIGTKESCFFLMFPPRK